jgi:hypothetical protein
MPDPVVAQSAPEDAERINTGVNVLLMGPAGTGKTFSLGTFVDADPNIECFYLGMEAGLETLFGYWRDKKKEIPPNLHWHMQEAGKASFKELIDSATLINTMSLDALAKMPDPNKGKHNQYIKMLETLNNFPDDRTGKKFGAVDDWGTNKALFIDGLTGLGRACMSLVVGGKAVRSPSDWGIGQDTLEKLLRMLCDQCKCHFVLIAHVERETDQISGGSKVSVSTLGQKLPPKLPPMFSEVILAKRPGNDKWVWDTGDPTADTKARNLPFAGNLPPDFKPVLEKWKSRGGVV